MTATHIGLHAFLFSSRYRWLRGVSLCLLMFLFSYAEMGYHYDYKYGMMPLMWLYMAGAICKIIPLSILISLLASNLLPKRQYVRFWCITFLTLMLFLFVQHVLEAVIYNHFGMPFWRMQGGGLNLYYLLDFCVQTVQWFVVCMGMSIGVLLKYWMTETRRKHQIQVSQLQMESELLKEQVSSALLYETLHQSGVLAESEPAKASERLLLLSRLLRYQLYDCRSPEVTLDSEVKFLRNYLELLKLNGACINYSLTCTGRTLGIFVPPLLFVSLVCPTGQRSVDIAFSISDKSLNFRITGCDLPADDVKVRHRLARLYPERHTLSLLPHNASLTLQLK